MLYRTYLAPSKIHGVGCFAAEKINAGAVVWCYDPRVDIQMSPNDLNELPAAAREQVLRYGYMDTDGWVTICYDDARCINHADAPNVMAGGTYDSYDVAVRDIEVDEEITTDYRTYDHGACGAFLIPKQS